MATRLTAVRALAGLLLGLAVLAGLILLASSTGPRGGVPAAPGTVTAATRRPPATAGGPPATPRPDASAAAATTPTRPAPASGDPCRLVTSAEAAAALGRPVAKIQRRRGFLLRSCLFASAGGSREVIVQLHRGPAASEAQFRMGRRPDDQPVAGVGDEAWFAPGTCLLDVRKGAARFQVGLLDVTGRPASRRVPPGLLSLARAVADRV
jgi:hypothetical protein